MSNDEFLPFARPSLSEEAIAEVVATLRSGWITTGPRVARFEAMLSEYHGGRT
ncbi:MAG: DegT/DnrJ/EryC1/StrS aminotransferase family protein, partial [Alphaproteobacteria bacterium]|nr:DegT/DnrJ/EryC1/StrS aminotransferase family protein [Alphaproteobacteria bacterium]